MVAGLVRLQGYTAAEAKARRPSLVRAVLSLAVAVLLLGGPRGPCGLRGIRRKRERVRGHNPGYPLLSGAAVPTYM